MIVVQTAAWNGKAFASKCLDSGEGASYGFRIFELMLSLVSCSADSWDNSRTLEAGSMIHLTARLRSMHERQAALIGAILALTLLAAAARAEKGER
jgi:hypothetical protein